MRQISPFSIAATVLARLLGVGVLLASANASALCDPDDPSEQSLCLLSELGGCEVLHEFLASKLAPSAINGIHPATLIIDQSCKVEKPLLLPRRMTLAGVGIGGDGSLRFPALTPGQQALSIDNAGGNPNEGVFVTIRDLSIYGPGHEVGTVGDGTGLALVDDSQVTLERVRIANFHTAVLGLNSFSVNIAHSTFNDNVHGLHLAKLANTWRIRDNIIKQASGWGALVNASNDVLFDGNRFESNAQGGVRVDSDVTLISNNRFENEGSAGAHEGIRIEPGAFETRVGSNLFSASTLNDFSSTTHCWFNIIDPAPIFTFAC